jgi:hypothetical protein
MNPVCSRISWKYQKNKQFIETFLFRNAPEFVYKEKTKEIEGEIPVFTFHMAHPETFEAQCLHLVENGYKTLTADEFLYSLASPGRQTKKNVLLTFDDGLKQVWTVAFPLLKKYNLKATCFLIPGCIPEGNDRIRPNLENYWRGEASIEKVLTMGGDDPPLAMWEEIKVMHDSGVIDFQSHTMHHSLVFTSNRIFDFVHPGYGSYYYRNIEVPLYTKSGKDVVPREAIAGMPIYFAKPRMSAASRYFDDEKIRNRCIDIVKNNGGEEFFSEKNWRMILRRAISDYRKSENVEERYETPEERNRAIFEDLIESKKMIEDKLPGKKVMHLCYPWYEAEDFAIRISREAGFATNFFGQLRGRPTNRPGDDPFRIVRVEGPFLERLPGSKRKGVREILLKMFKLKGINTPMETGEKE